MINRRALGAVACLGVILGCGTIMQGPKQRVKITTDPEGATVTIRSHRVTSPAELELKRAGWTVIRAEKPGYYPTCKVVRAAHNPLYAIANSIPAGLGWIVDGPSQASRTFPETIHVQLAPLRRRTPMAGLPPDDQILIQWRQGNTQVCSAPVDVADRAVWGASYQAALVAVRGTSGASITDMSDGRYGFKDASLAMVVQPSSRGIDLRITNTSKQAMKVIWDDFALVSPDGASARVIHSGVPFEVAHEPQTPTLVPPGGHIVDRIIPATGQPTGLFLPILIRPCDMDEPQFISLAQKQSGSQFKLVTAFEMKGSRHTLEIAFKVGEPRLRRATTCVANRLRAGVTPPADSWPY